MAVCLGSVAWSLGSRAGQCRGDGACDGCRDLDACSLAPARRERRVRSESMVWQIDPEKCVQCGRCATSCVLMPSAVKCVHAFSMCGYCKLCFGYFQPRANKLNEAAENQVCPTGAIKRDFVESPYYSYTIDEELCIGCGKCVEGCAAFGNGSLHLQVRHDACVNCNDCSIARVCAGDAFSRVPADKPYRIKTAS
jgi:electron transport complex protein RnfB